MSDNELFGVLLGALALALWLRGFLEKRASGKKLGFTAANAAIVGVASAVVGVAATFARRTVTGRVVAPRRRQVAPAQMSLVSGRW